MKKEIITTIVLKNQFIKKKKNKKQKFLFF